MPEKKHDLSGRGAQHHPFNRFLKQSYVHRHMEGLDEAQAVQPHTQIYYEEARTVINQVNSPDLGMVYSLNPYQGCEHGCSYCYARPTHEYYGFSAGLDFESRIMVKRNAPILLEKTLANPDWQPAPIALSGNTDCYQPLERSYRLTRQLLEIFVRYRHPVSIITKNRLILRDVDLLQELSRQDLVHVYISVTTLNDDLRRIMEPRTTTSHLRLQTISALSQAGIPVGVMIAPVIPALNDHEILNIAKAAANHGARTASYTVLRLNGSVADVFEKWLRLYFPDRFGKVWNQIRSLHDGQVSDFAYGRRLRGTGLWADMIEKMMQTARNRYFADRQMPPYNLRAFRRGGMLSLFTDS
jgi:DNA repair photolyase